ncbi:MAG: DUF1905 domain-containing protein [Chthonomonadales bacterium]|nr:DUF1905 domain-containing protein [Chthonomonadales bacterium]
MQEHSFRATVTAVKGRAFIVLPFDPDDVWGKRTRHDLTGSVAGHDYRGKVERTDHGAVLALGPTWRKDNGVAVGDEVEVVLRPEGPQVTAMAADLATAFEADPEAREIFEGMSTFCRKNYLRWIEDAKRPETRARRISEMMQMLRNDSQKRGTEA